MPTPSVDGQCDDVTEDEQGTVYVNGEAVEEDPWLHEYGEQMPRTVLRLGARAAATSDSIACLQVELPEVIVSGFIEICGPATAERMAPFETPPAPNPGPTMPPTYGVSTINGVEIPERITDANSVLLLDIADVEDVPACFYVQADANDVYVTLSLAVCTTAQLETDGTLTLSVGDLDWPFLPEYVYDDLGALVVGQAVEVGLDIRNYRDDVIHLVEMAVWATPGCP